MNEDINTKIMKIDQTPITQYNSECRYCDEVITSSNVEELGIELMYHVVEAHIDAGILYNE